MTEENGRRNVVLDAKWDMGRYSDVCLLCAIYLDHDDGRRHLPAGREVEVESLVVDHLLRESLRHHLGKRLLLGLRLTGQLRATVTEPRYVVLGNATLSVTYYF